MIITQNSFGDLVAWTNDGAYLGMAMREVTGEWGAVVAAQPFHWHPCPDKEHALATLMDLLLASTQTKH